MRNGSGTGLQIIEIKDAADGLLTIRNCILDGDDVLLIFEESLSTATFDITDNLFESSGTTGWFSFDDETGCADKNDVGATAPLNDSGASKTGDPLFESINDTLDEYLRLGLASPGYGKGNDSFGGSTDLKGIPYGSPKHMGCRASSIRHKHNHLRQMMAV